ncbi:hypothetical protein SLEP1_g44503 [Rubroshorea leprosula]|uniref:Sacsin n=1 Tax=Rubroshorea leprosula TaxID=152421 RepID=A0AAV5LGU0_9ROSI|nr:hypothetical protein SLEP1_g44503 [Rubroshorea leprosula]
MATPRDHVEKIRKIKFSIGGDPNPLTEDLHQAVRNLSAELYTKDVHFLMELIQPYIFSNGYQIRFNEGPCPHSNLGYIVPEWVDENPTLSDIKEIYGSTSSLPTTIIVLPLKPDKVKAVKKQLSSVHPEVLLFLSKIKRFSVRKDNEDPKLNTVNAIAITSETDFVTRKKIDAESYTLRLAAAENGDKSEKECTYYMWRQKFPVRKENKVERRMEVDQWVITLAFPYQERLHRGAILPGVYAFLPTEMITNFPFIIQADFVLSSSRETILLDNKWNQGILDCVPSAFVSAFISLVKLTEDAPMFNLPLMFGFLPVNSSSYAELNAVRESIRAKLVEEEIVPTESGLDQRLFHKPHEVGRIQPVFWDILKKAREEGVSLHNLSSHGRYILHSSFDKAEYDQILNFLGVSQVNYEWYAKCIEGSNLVLWVSDNVYTELLLFIARNWPDLCGTNIKKIPLLKYVSKDENVSLCSIDESFHRNDQMVLCLSSTYKHAPWMIDCNQEFRCVTNHHFMPKSTHEAFQLCSEKLVIVLPWLQKQAKVVCLDVYDYAWIVNKNLPNDRKLAVTYAHFLCHSLLKKFLSADQVSSLCATGSMPLVDDFGCVRTRCKGVLVPANGSKWVNLVISNLWKQDDYVVLGEDYLLPGNFAGQRTSSEQLINFLKSYASASDIPQISPPNSGIRAVSRPLTKENTFLLLDWVQKLKLRGERLPEKFLKSLRNGNWLKITINGSSSYGPPSQSFFHSSSWGNILQNGSVLVGIPLIDQSFYGDGINKYKEALKTLGVMFESGEACQFIGENFMSLEASSTLSKGKVLSVLNFIRYLRENLLPPEKFIGSIETGTWLRTCHGDMCPAEAVLFDQEWKTASQISDIPFLDDDYYGEEILYFKTELQLLGVVVGFHENYELVVNYLKPKSYLTSLNAQAFLLILKCMKHLKSKEKLIAAVAKIKCLKTNQGFKSPHKCFLSDPEWGGLLQIFNCFPIIDHEYYGSEINSYKDELKELGAIVGFLDAVKAFASTFRQKASKSSITKENVFSFLSFYRKQNRPLRKFHPDLRNCIREERWLRTNLGDFRSPKDCVLYSPEWKTIYPISLIPFIDSRDNYYGKDIYGYKDELQSLGVVVEFKSGVKFVADGLRFPQDPCRITPENALSLLKCVGILLEKGNDPLPEGFLKKVSTKWLKTKSGYLSPDECLLFDNSSGLEQADGPFIDEEFYGPDIRSYTKELNAIGVIVDVEKGCELIGCHLSFHSEFSTITRIYNFLHEKGWKPNSEATRKIWIPDGSDNGHWVDPDDCVLHSGDGLFGLQLNVLEKYYKNEVPLQFFYRAFKVRANLSLDDYCRIWNTWETSRAQLSNDECNAFWGYVMRQQSSRTERILAERLVKLPVDSGSDGVLLLDKRDVFIADDLQLKDVFVSHSPHPLFVWYPQPSLPSLSQTKLLELYKKIGVRTLSESVQKEESSSKHGLELKQVNPSDVLIVRGLIRLLLGFLACCLTMEVEKRHKAVQCLLNLTVFETSEPATLSYSLSLSSDKMLNVRVSQMIHWDRESSKLYTVKIDRTASQKILLEYASCFSEKVAKGVLWDKEDHINSLSELIKSAFLLRFDEEAVSFLLKSKNLQIFKEDEEFLAAAFPCE